jgi:glycosyltransferase involved in cell wall biosynthesis
MSDRSPISVVVPTRDRADMLDGCLKTLRRSLDDADEMIVVDSVSRDERVREVAIANEAIYVRCDEPGASRARNAGVRRATRGIVAFIDDDIQVDAGWAAAVSRVFDDHPETAFVTGSIGFPGDEPDFAVAKFLHPDPFVIDRDFADDPGHSANLAVRRDAFERIGGFDELLGAGAKYLAAEDKDLLDRLLGAGYLGRYEPTAGTVHLDWRGEDEIIRLNWTYGLGAGVRMTKLLKTDRARLPQQGKILFWTWGLRDLLRSIRWRSKFHTKVVGVRLLGMIAGMLWALPARVRDGHFMKPGHRLLRRQ